MKRPEVESLYHALCHPSMKKIAVQLQKNEAHTHFGKDWMWGDGCDILIADVEDMKL